MSLLHLSFQDHIVTVCTGTLISPTINLIHRTLLDPYITTFLLHLTYLRKQTTFYYKNKNSPTIFLLHLTTSENRNAYMFLPHTCLIIPSVLGLRHTSCIVILTGTFMKSASSPYHQCRREYSEVNIIVKTNI